MNDTDTQNTSTQNPRVPETEEDRRRSLLLGRTADGQRAEPPTAGGPAQPQPASWTPYAAPPGKKPGLLERWKARGGVLGTLASLLLLLAKIGAPVLAVLAKFKFLLIFGKLLLGGGTMLLSAWAYASIYGAWEIGAGIVGLIFIHECGHALAARMRGIPTGIMVFVPFMGAFVTTKRAGKNIAEDAFIGIMGPVFGTLAGLGCLLLYLPFPSPYWLVLAQFCFFMNLFNLAPTPPLDGGWITPLFSPKLLAIGAILLLFVARYNPLVIILALLSLPRIIAGWKAKPEDSDYYQATAADRWKYGAVYLGLAAFLAVAGFALQAHLHLPLLPHRRPVA
jgi:Zn-dependent protease